MDPNAPEYSYPGQNHQVNSNSAAISYHAQTEVSLKQAQSSIITLIYAKILEVYGGTKSIEGCNAWWKQTNEL